jgi:DNA-binding FadR family transcriptional regulator
MLPGMKRKPRKPPRPFKSPAAAIAMGRLKRSQGAGLANEPARNIHDYLAKKLGRDIVGGFYQPGDQLPNEIDLRQHLSVSRTALREAYRVLAAKGLITSRQNVGTRVRPRADWNVLDADVLLWHLAAGPDEQFVVDLFELRLMLEPAAAARAARVGSADAVGRIAAAYEEMEQGRDGSGDLIGADVRFHQAILAATHNPMIAALGVMIHTALVGSFTLGWPSAATMSAVRFKQHRAILDAIRAHDAEDARACSAALLQVSMDDVRRALKASRARKRRQ